MDLQRILGRAQLSSLSSLRVSYRLAVALLLGVVPLAGCATGTLEDDYSRPPFEPVETADTDPPSQREIDRMVDDMVDDAAPKGGQGGSRGITCIDVTSFDYDWENDMFCTRPDGSSFYTSYEGAAQHR
jgi:hypothetical protein